MVAFSAHHCVTSLLNTDPSVTVSGKRAWSLRLIAWRLDQVSPRGRSGRAADPDLLSLVAGTWAMDRKKPDGEEDGAGEEDAGYDEAKANKRSDFYFAFFLSCALPSYLLCRV